MVTIKQVVLYAGIGVLAVTAGYLLRAQLTEGSAQNAIAGTPPPMAKADAVLAAVLPDIQGKPQPIAQWKGKVLVVNFWATWCEPCRKEIPEFMEMQDHFRDKGVVFVGIAMDQKDRVASYSKEMGINYPVLVGDMDVLTLAGTVGNLQGALPYTVIIDSSGKIISTHFGRLRREKMEPILTSLVK